MTTWFFPTNKAGCEGEGPGWLAANTLLTDGGIFGILQCAFCKKEIVASNQTQKKVHAETHDQKVWTKEKCWPDDTFA